MEEDTPVIRTAATAADLDEIRKLFREYGESLRYHLCFESFEKELAQLPGDYAVMLLAFINDQAAGCVALREHSGGSAELKRLYVRPEFRGTGAGRLLAEEVIRRARESGYAAMRLETLPDRMPAAVSLYRRLGFEQVGAPSRDGAIDMQLTLR